MSIKSFPGGHKLDWEGLENVPSLVKTVNGVTPDSTGNVEITIPDSSQNGDGLTSTEKNLILSLFKGAAYTADMSETITRLENLWSGSGGGEEPENPDIPDIPDIPDEPDEPDTPVVTLSSISATYDGGDVAVGTAVADLTGIVVTAHYSDGSSKTVTGYTLSGEIAEGENTVTVAYQGKTATFAVTGIAESTGENNGWVVNEPYAIEWTDGYKVDTNSGENVADTARSVSDFIPCLGVSGLVGGAGINGGYLYAYDADKTYLGRIEISASSPATVNRNVAFVKLHCLTGSKATATLVPQVYEELTESTAWEAGKYYRASYIESTDLSVDTGVVKNKNGHWASDYMLCYGATSMTVTNIQYTKWRNQGVFYDAGKNYITGWHGNSVPWRVPENAMYFRVSGIDGFEYTIQKPNRPWITLRDDLFHIDKKLTNVASGNSASTVDKGAAYTTTLTASSGYVLDSVIVTMGGVDVTADVYVEGVVTIPAVNGHIEITAIAVAEEA